VLGPWVRLPFIARIAACSVLGPGSLSSRVSLRARSLGPAPSSFVRSQPLDNGQPLASSGRPNMSRLQCSPKRTASLAVGALTSSALRRCGNARASDPRLCFCGESRGGERERDARKRWFPKRCSIAWTSPLHISSSITPYEVMRLRLQLLYTLWGCLIR
jgi:hypothetical protein